MSAHLTDGLNRYKNEGFFSRASMLEKKAQEILLQLIAQQQNPTDDALNEAWLFLIDVEDWKAGSNPRIDRNASKNLKKVVWDVLCDAVDGNNINDDDKTLSAIMRLKGFGQGNGSTKIATAVLRFLWPEEWGVVDWRIFEMINLLKKHSWDIDKSLDQAKNFEAIEEDKKQIIPKALAIELNKLYRDKSKESKNDLPRAADVDMAIFGLSLLAWPLLGTKSNKKCRY
jgi:hypothetical protein